MTCGVRRRGLIVGLDSRKIHVETVLLNMRDSSILTSVKSGGKMEPLRNHIEVDMATTITIKNMPKELHEDLKASAARHRRSLNKEIIAILEEEMHPRIRLPEEVLADIHALRERFKNVRLTEEEIDHAKKEGRH
jgi:plasmid stability protein